MRLKLFVLSIALLLFAQVLTSQTMGQPEEFTAGAIDINTGRTGTVQISIDRWSTSAEREALVKALFEKGQDRLLTFLQLHINPDGKGEGKLSVAARITGDEDDRMIEIENYQHQPVSLIDVTSHPKD